MTFLNIILLGGAAAALIPLIIHLLNRHRFRVVKWGAMHFLDAVLLQNRRRLRMEQLILLLLRMAIPAFLAICMARPILTGSSTLARRAMSSMVVLLDNSYSMEAGETGRSHFQQSRETASSILAQLPRGSEAGILGLAGPIGAGLEEPSYDIDDVRKRLASARGGFGSAAVGPRLEAAAGLFASRLHHADRTLVVLSDFQRASWSPAGAAARARALEILKAQPVVPRLVFLPVGRDVADNVSVESVEVSRAMPGVGQRVLVRANLRNHGRQGWPDLRVYFRVDGVERSVARIPLPPGETGQVLFPYAFDKAGSHVVEVSADADPLAADNTGRASLPVLDNLPVLVVNGAPSPSRFENETAFLEIALRPFGSGGGTAAPAAGEAGAPPDLVRSRTVTEDEFKPEDLAGVRAVILANVRQVDDRRLEALQNFVRDGGGLLVFPGDRVNTGWYNSRFFADGAGLLPARLGALAGDLTEDAADASVVSQHFSHPALAVFNDPRKGGLQGARLRLRYRLEPPAAAVSRAAAVVPARLDSGDPFLVERPYGQGRVVLACTTCDADWGNLPLRPFYLPLVQELTAYLASQVYPPRNVLAGERLAALLPPGEAGRPAVFTDPEGATYTRVAAAAGLHSLVEFADTERPGLYLLKTPGGATIHFVVRTPPGESDIARLSDAEIDAVAKECDATVVRSAAEFQAMESKRRWGREIWKPLLAIVLAMLFAELILVPYFLRRRPS